MASNNSISEKCAYIFYIISYNPGLEPQTFWLWVKRRTLAPVETLRSWNYKKVERVRLLKYGPSIVDHPVDRANFFELNNPLYKAWVLTRSLVPLVSDYFIGSDWVSSPLKYEDLPISLPQFFCPRLFI